jgi:type III secretion protein L
MFAPAQISLDNLPTGPGSKILRAGEVDAWQDGFRFLAAVRGAAEQIEQATRDAQAAAHKQGFAEGKAAGEAEATRLVHETSRKVDQYLARLEREIAALVFDIVRRVLGNFDPAELVADAVTQALSEFRRDKSLKVTVHPAAQERVSGALAALTNGGGGPVVTVETDASLDEGACVIVSDFAVVDASVEAQLRVLAAGFATSEQGAIS